MFATLTRPQWFSNDVRRFNRLMDEVLGQWSQGDESSSVTAAWVPPVDVFEGKDAVRIVAELPGVRPEDVKLSIENQTLTLRGEKKQAAEESTETVHRYERSYGSFARSFRLPETVDADRIEARYEHGVLTVTLPKSEKTRAREIAVKVQ
jgi:HSP20 family protein